MKKKVMKTLIKTLAEKVFVMEQVTEDFMKQRDEAVSSGMELFKEYEVLLQRVKDAEEAISKYENLIGCTDGQH